MRLALLRPAALAALLITVSACDPLNNFLGINHPVERLVTHVISVRPHDSQAFTEGLVYDAGKLYESTGYVSTGQSSRSSLREVDPQTGEVLRNMALPDVFGEGLALVDDNLIQLTWTDHVAYVTDRASFERQETLDYPDEGWGMCYDGEHLYTSDGSSRIVEREPEKLAPVGSIDVTYQNQPVTQINELECVGDSIYANVWHTDFIIRIDKATGQIRAIIDASNLLTPEQRAALPTAEAVLNGIAYDPESDTFLVTGKLWDSLFEVEFVPQ